MRAYEFIREEKIDEVIPAVLGAIGGALLRGGAAAGTALARGAVAAGRGITSIGSKVAQGTGTALKTAATSAASSLGATAGANVANKLTGQGQQEPPKTPTVLPSNTKIEPVIRKPGDKPTSMRFKIGDAEFVLDDPQAIQQLSKLGVQ